MAPSVCQEAAAAGGGEECTDLRDLAADSQRLAMAMSSDTPDSQYLVGRLVSEHAPAMKSVHETLLSVTAKLNAVKTRKEELVALTKMCTFVAAATVIVVSRQRQRRPGGSGDNKKIRRLLNLGPLEECVCDLQFIVERIGKRRKKPLLRRSNSVVKTDIADLNSRVFDLAREMGLAGVLAVFKGVLEDTGADHRGLRRGNSGSDILTPQEVNLARQPKPAVQQARVPSKTPPRESWHVRRERIISTTFENLLAPGAGWSGGGIDAGEGVAENSRLEARPRLVGLVGESGSGKTATAAEIVRSPEVLEYFSDGVVWLPVNEGDGEHDRLRALMHRLAKMVREDIDSLHGVHSEGGGGGGGDFAAGAMGAWASVPAFSPGPEGRGLSGGLEDGAAYVKSVMTGGETHGGVRQRRELRCLVVADNVCEPAVIAKLRETGMWVLLTSCSMGMVREAGGRAVAVGSLLEADADWVLRRASELPSDASSPAGAKELVELCGGMALDLSFVGRWSTVRGSKDPMAWQDAADNIRADLQNLELTQEEEDARGGGGGGSGSGNPKASTGGDRRRKRPPLRHHSTASCSTNDDGATASVSSIDAASVHAPSCSSSSQAARDARGNRRKAVLRAGFRDLVIGAGDPRVRYLYLALAVLPDGHEFTAKDAAVLLRGSQPGGGAGDGAGAGVGVRGWNGQCKGGEERAARKVLRTLEAWNILAPTEERGGRGGGGKAASSYRMHRCQSRFAREILLECHEILRCAVTQWVAFVSSLDAVLFFEPLVLVGLWRAVEDVGGPSWRDRRPYEAALGEIDNGDPLCRLCLVAVAKFRDAEGDWDGASLMWRRLLAVEQRAFEPNVMYPLWELVNLAEKKGRPEEATVWRQYGLETLNLAMVRSSMISPVEAGGGYDGSSAGAGYTAAAAAAGNLKDTTDTAAVIRSLTLNMVRFGPAQGMEAEMMLRRALEIEISRRGPDDIRVAATLQRLGVCVRQAGRLKEAEQLLTRALKIEEAKLGEDDVLVARTLLQLGITLRLAGRLQDAERLLWRNLDIETANGGAHDVNVARALHELGLCVRPVNGRLEEASGLFARSLAIKEDKMSPDNPSVGQSLYELGVCFRQEGRLKEAEAFLRRALGIKKAAGVAEGARAAAAAVIASSIKRPSARRSHSCSSKSSSISRSSEVSVAPAMFQLGVCILEGGRRLEEAEALLRSALEIEEETLGADDVLVVRIALHLGVCLGRAGRREEAEKVLAGCVRKLKAGLGAGHEEVVKANEMLHTFAATE
eukprot:g10353.t2